MDILDDMGVNKLSAKVFLKVNYSFNGLVDFLNTHCSFRFQKGACERCAYRLIF